MPFKCNLQRYNTGVLTVWALKAVAADESIIADKAAAKVAAAAATGSAESYGASSIQVLKGLEIEVKRLEALADGSAVGLCTLNQVDP